MKYISIHLKAKLTDEAIIFFEVKFKKIIVMEMGHPFHHRMQVFHKLRGQETLASFGDCLQVHGIF
jgi:hypothetical protein